MRNDTGSRHIWTTFTLAGVAAVGVLAGGCASRMNVAGGVVIPPEKTVRVQVSTMNRGDLMLRNDSEAPVALEAASGADQQQGMFLGRNHIRLEPKVPWYQRASGTRTFFIWNSRSTSAQVAYSLSTFGPADVRVQVVGEAPVAPAETPAPEAQPATDAPAPPMPAEPGAPAPSPQPPPASSPPPPTPPAPPPEPAPAPPADPPPGK